jgi:hypothetical protein
MTQVLQFNVAELAKQLGVADKPIPKGVWLAGRRPGTRNNLTLVVGGQSKAPSTKIVKQITSSTPTNTQLPAA